MFRATVILCTIAAQVLAAPNPNDCIESCSTYHSQQTHETLNQQQNAGLDELHRMAASQLKELEFSRPGNWTEQNEYRTNDGRGRIYEEQGQVVNGPRRVKYYKKKYSSSYGVNPDVGVLGGVHSTLDSQRLTGATSGLGSVVHRNAYDEQLHQEVRQSTNRDISHSGRLEDFGERVDDTQQVLHGVSSVPSGGNWHREDSWRTDGGRGVVHEKEGQVVNGPTKINYYHQNYSSSYSSGDAGVMVPSIAQPNLEAELQHLHSKLDNYGREIQRSTVGQSSMGRMSQTVEHAGYGNENILATTNIRPQPVSTYESTHEQQQSTIHHGAVAAPVSSSYHRARDERYQEADSSGRDYSATNSHVDDRRDDQTSQRFYVVPSRPLTTVHKSDAHHSYQETLAPQSQIVLTNANGQSMDRVNGQLLHVPIHTNSNYRSFHSSGDIEGNRRMNTHSQIQTAEEIRQAQVRRSQILNQNLQSQNSYHNGNVEMVNLVAQQPAAVNRYEEKWSERYQSHSTVPQDMAGQMVVGQHANYVKIRQTPGQLGSYTAANSHKSHSSHESGSHFYEGFRTQPDQLVTGSLNLGKIGQTGADCDQGVATSEQYQYGSLHQRKFKRDAEPWFHGKKRDDLRQQSQQVEDLTQQTAGFDDFYQQHSGNLQYGQHSQQTEDLTQQTNGFGDYSQQTSGNLNVGRQEQQQPSGKLEFGQETQQTEDLTQQTGAFDSFTQQTSGNLEFGQQHQQQHFGKLEFGQRTQEAEDLTQQTGGFNDFTQQTSGKLEFGQQRQHGMHEFGQESQQTEDFTQQTGGIDDFTQQTSGKLEFAQQRQHGMHGFGQESQQTEDFTQQTGGIDDFTQQQTSGNLEFGQQSQHGKRIFDQETQQTEDLTQQTGELHSFTQQTSGKLEFEQKSHDAEDLTQQTSGHGDDTFGNLEFGQRTQDTEDLTQQTGGFDDFTQQTSGKLEFGQQHQHGKRKFDQETQQTEDLTQQTEGLDDFTQQTSGNLEFGQQRQHGNRKFDQETQQTEDLTQQTEDLTQQTEGLDDFTQQTSGNLEFGQQRQHGKRRFDQETQQTEDLTQQTEGLNDFTQQTSGNLEFGQQRQHGNRKFDQETQQTEYLTQQTEGLNDFTQQTSGNLEFGQQRQHGKRKFDQETQQTEDLTQQTGGFDDFTQKTSTNLEFGQQCQHGKREYGQETQQTEDLTQQTGELHSFTQQTSGNLEFGQQHQQQHFGKLEFGQRPQETEDLTQQTGGFDDFTQQTSGKLEFGQQRQHGMHGFGQESQQTEDFTQQTSGNLEFGQQNQHGKRKFDQETQQTEDLTQQTGGLDDFTQQTSGNLEFGQQRQHGTHKFAHETQQTEDLTQQTGGFDDFTQQTSGNLEFGQQRQHGKHEFGQHTQHSSDFSQQTGGFGDFTQQPSGNLELGQDQQQTGTFEFGETTTAKPQKAYIPGVKGGRRRKPAPKPTLRPGRRYDLGNDVRHTNLPLSVYPEPDPDHSPMYHQPQDIPTVLGIDEQETQQFQNQESSHQNNHNAHWHLNHQSDASTNSENVGNHPAVDHQVVHEEHVTQTMKQYETKPGGFHQQTEGPDHRQSTQDNPMEGQSNEPVFKLEPRIIEAYGGAGAYNANHNDDLFTEAKYNPSATLPPNPEGVDPWDIREKPVEAVDRPRIYARPTEATTTTLPEEPTTTPAPSFWSRVGNKFTNTYEKAKEKATSIFG